MKGKKLSTQIEPTAVVFDDSSLNGKLKSIGGSTSDDWNNLLADQTVQALWLKNSDPATKDQQYIATLAALVGINPKDELEGMMAAQLIAAHNAAMECYRRAMIVEQTFEGRRENLAQANKLSRTYAALIDALNRHRGKGQQKVTVEHVHVHSGGQAIVGSVEARGEGAQSKLEHQSHAQQIADAPELAMRCPNTEADCMPIASYGERALPDAWGQGARRSEGK